MPLAESWDSGASAWTATERERYANYLDDPEHLVAVTARSNRQEADKDPSQWLPIPTARCRYITAWTRIKRHWNLTVDQQEKGTLIAEAHQCPNQPLNDPTAP